MSIKDILEKIDNGTKEWLYVKEEINLLNSLISFYIVIIQQNGKNHWIDAIKMGWKNAVIAL